MMALFSSDSQFPWIPVSSDAPLWTDIASAIGDSIAALVALGVAVYSVKVALGERHAQVKREQEAREAERRDQAERVSCWMTADNTAVPANWINVDNASAQPIWDVTIRHELLPEGSHSIPVIPANRSHRVNVNPGGRMHPPQVVDVSFRDNRGQRWRRNSEIAGSLYEEDLIGNPTAVMGDTS